MNKAAGWSATSESLILTGATWLFFLAIEIGLTPSGWPLSLVWATHGLLLTLVLNAILLATRNWQAALKIVVAFCAVLVIGLGQAHLDVWTGRQFFTLVLQSDEMPKLVRIGRDGSELDIRLMINTAIYLWMFSFYAAAVSLMIARKAAFDARFAAQNAQLEALRLQLAPHFLFNALNSISTLIFLGRAGEAEEMTHRLSAFFRATLMNSGSDPVTLMDELEAVSDYLDVERVRFGNQLSVDIQCPADVTAAAVPGLILQPLVENVIKHAVSTTDKPVTLTVVASRQGDKLRIVLTDDFQGQSSSGGTGVGLRNIRDRLKTLYGEAGELETGPGVNGYRSVLTMPFVPLDGLASV